MERFDMDPILVNSFSRTTSSGIGYSFPQEFENEELRFKVQRLEKEVQILTSQLRARKDIEEQLIQAQKLEPLALLSAGIAHDFNNLLQAILGYSQLARMRLLAETGNAAEMDQIETIVTQGTELTSQIISMGRKAKSASKSVNLNECVRGTELLLRRTLPKTITVKLDLDQDLGVIRGDQGQLHQILMNLVINARDAMGKEGVLQIATHALSAEDVPSDVRTRIPAVGYAELSVSDTGRGIPLPLLKRIFEPYFTTKQKGSGTGLGLSIVRDLVSKHNGTVSCDSTPGRGTNFRIYFPMSAGAVEAPDRSAGALARSCA